MKWIHRGCLQHWLTLSREQGYRRKAFRCEVCKAQYDLTVVEGREATKASQRIQYTLKDPYYWASVLHGAWRIYVATTGVKLAISQYSIVSRSLQQQMGRSIDHASLVQYMRLKFDRATMVQVYWYTALMAILPQPPNLDAFGGMAVGSVIGGMLAQVTFLPMMGCGVPSALCSSLALAARCSSRLLAAHFCCGWGHRVLINACKAIAGLLHRVRNRQQPAALPAAAGAGGVVGQRQAAAAPRPWEV